LTTQVGLAHFIDV